MINKPPVKKRYYKIGIGYYDIWTTDKEIAFKLFNLMSEGSCFIPSNYSSGHSYDEKFWYRQRPKEIKLSSVETEIYENSTEAEDSRRRYDKAYKMKLITKKKKKKIP